VALTALAQPVTAAADATAAAAAAAAAVDDEAACMTVAVAGAPTPLPTDTAAMLACAETTDDVDGGGSLALSSAGELPSSISMSTDACAAAAGTGGCVAVAAAATTTAAASFLLLFAGRGAVDGIAVASVEDPPPAAECVTGFHVTRGVTSSVASDALFFVLMVNALACPRVSLKPNFFGFSSLASVTCAPDAAVAADAPVAVVVKPVAVSTPKPRATASTTPCVS
jgi:hypothetical protein